MGETIHENMKKYQLSHSEVIKDLAHGTVVSNLAYLVGKQMKFSADECYDLALAGFLHDIGKLELAKYVRKMEEKRLMIEEMRYVRGHSMVGALILQEKGYSQNIVDMVKFHHENCDGSGYPLNLSRKDIPIGARILRVCDVFAALTADRTYRKAFDLDTAMKMMIEESKKFDVQVFLAFMNVFHQEDMAAIVDTGQFQKLLAWLITGDHNRSGFLMSEDYGQEYSQAAMDEEIPFARLEQSE
jgi:putative nucleotidyltransferase with HDIG domain